jgi:pimeloyl-ACP methyl ester carboxylesterase
VPALVIASGRDPSVSLDKLRALKTASTVELKTYADADPHFTGRQGEVTLEIANWLAAQRLGVPPRVLTRVLDVPTEGGRILQGLLYRPQKAPDPRQPALILVGGRTADTIQSSTQWMGTRLAAKGFAVFAPGMRVSGIAGFESSTHAEAAEDIGRWIDRAAALGYKRIVLTGHSNGGIWISNYMSLHDDKRVVGLVYFAPTRNTRSSADGPEGAQWERDLQTARAAVARGDGMRQIIGLMTAQAWLDNNGPDSRGVHTQRVTEFDRPALSITGAKDALMTEDFVAAFNAAYRGKLTAIRYPDGSHGLRENKGRVADDVAAWLKATFR